jgi:hypothetical protein
VGGEADPVCFFLVSEYAISGAANRVAEMFRIARPDKTDDPEQRLQQLEGEATGRA